MVDINKCFKCEKEVMNIDRCYCSYCVAELEQEIERLMKIIKRLKEHGI